MTDLPKKNEVSKESFNPKLHIGEYKRTCNECGRVWHSLVEREGQISKKMKSNACLMCGNTCSGSEFGQHSRNFDANENSLTLLKKCPQCGSGNYTETVIYYEKKEQPAC